MKTGIYWQDPKYALKPGRDFIFDPSLVLYLPLHRLDGASFMSRDAYGHLCTVTGALWRPYGRYFDGSDDVIKCGANTALDIVTAGTLEAWVNVTTFGDNEGVTAKGTTNGYWGLKSHSAGAFRFRVNDGVNNFRAIASGNSTDTWYHLVGVGDGRGATSLRIYVNTALKQSADISTLGSLVDNTKNLWIGEEERNAAFFHGLIGEVRIYNRALTPLEIQRNYLATKWRYQ